MEKGETKMPLNALSPQGQEKKKIQYHWEIDAYKLSVEAAMEIYELSKSFPEEEKKT